MPNQASDTSIGRTGGPTAYGYSAPEHSPTTPFGFSEAFRLAAGGYRVARQGWNGKGLYVAAQFPDEHSKMGNPYLYIDAHALGGESNPWVPSQTDLFAVDWFIVQD